MKNIQEKDIAKLEHLPTHGHMKWEDENNRWDSYRGGRVYKNFKNMISRFLQKSVGKKWDDIYSILVHKHKTAKIPHDHSVERFIRWEIVTNTFETNEGIFYRRYGRVYPVSDCGLWVHPTTNILHKSTPPPRVDREESPSSYTITRGEYKGKQLKWLNGLWFVFWKELYSYTTMFSGDMIEYKEHYKQLNKKN